MTPNHALQRTPRCAFGLFDNVWPAPRPAGEQLLKLGSFKLFAMKPELSTAQSGCIIIRLLCLVGVLATVLLLGLGLGWPSAIYTPVAILALPSPLLFLVAIVRPSLIRNHRILRYYLIGCCVASALCWLDEVWWLHHVT